MSGREPESLEWWQWIAQRLQAWAGRHPVMVRRLLRVRAAWAWGSLVWLGVVVLIRPELRESLRVFAQVYWLLLVWFVVAPTRTISWSGLARMFGVCMAWSMAIGGLLFWVASWHRGFGGMGRVDDLGAIVAVAGVGEESLKLIPLVVIALAAPRRARAFAVTDWLLLGFASGLAFQAVEELARRAYLNVRRPGIFDFLSGVDQRSVDSGVPQYNWGPLSGWAHWGEGTFPGHHVVTALIAVTAGLALVAWRRAARCEARLGVWMLRGIAVISPVMVWWLAFSVHAGGNAAGSTGDYWLSDDHPSVPWLLRCGYQIAQRGNGVNWLLLVALVMALLVDARHRHQAAVCRAEAELVPWPWSATHWTRAWIDRWSTWASGVKAAYRSAVTTDDPEAGEPSLAPRRALTVLLAAGVEAFVALVAYTVRDFMVWVIAHASTTVSNGTDQRATVPDLNATDAAKAEADVRSARFDRLVGNRCAALARGRLAMKLSRLARQDAHAIYNEPEGRAAGLGRWRIASLMILVILVVAATWLAYRWAERIGSSTHLISQGTWLAGYLDDVGDWWSGLPLWQQVAIGIALAGLIALSGGSLGLAFAASGAATYLAEHAHGAATFTRDPRAATRSYISTTTPGEAVTDAAEFALTFLPFDVGGAAAGRLVRVTLEDVARDPQAWVAARRAVMGTDAGVIDLGAFMRREPIEWADGIYRGVLAPPEAAAFQRWENTLPPGRLRASGAAGTYQTRLYGPREVLVQPIEPKSWADGITSDYGVISDAKHRASGSSTWHIPESLPDFLQGKARKDIQFQLEKYARVIADDLNPARGLEIATNDLRVAQRMEKFLQDLSIPGYVRHEP